MTKYIVGGSKYLFLSLSSNNFTLYNSLFRYFLPNALPYEQVFSHYSILSELGHSYFSGTHIPESIVCQNYGAKYYLMHWSDNSLSINSYLTAFLGCDKFLVWGEGHIQNHNNKRDNYMLTGYFFKRFIKKVQNDKVFFLHKMGVEGENKVVSFFDETFGGSCKMTEKHYVNFWKTAGEAARLNENVTVFIKPKELRRFNNLSKNLKRDFKLCIDNLEKMPNVHIVDEDKWSFVEIIGVSDIVITQGMTSSATIAIICGIEGLYFDQAHYNHPFSSKIFKNKIVFDDSAKLLNMIHGILNNNRQLSAVISDNLLRKFDAYPDNRAIDILRDILTAKHEDNQHSFSKRIGVIVQARMGSSRLPGKVMKDIRGKPMLKHIIERLKRVKNINTIIIATTKNKNDDVIIALANKLKVQHFRGDENNVLFRYYEAAKKFGVDIIIRITADCPLVDPGLIEELVTYYLFNQSVGCVSNTIERTYPRGFDVEVFSFSVLEKAFHEAKENYQCEHVTPFIYENEKCCNYKFSKDYSKYRVTVDVAKDFELVTQIFKYFGNNEFGYREVIDLLEKNSELARINSRVEQKQVRA